MRLVIQYSIIARVDLGCSSSGTLKFQIFIEEHANLFH